MRISLIGLLFLTSQFLLSQDNNWPEITLGTYNYDSNECQPLIVSDGKSNLIYPCRNKDGNRKLDISEFESQLIRLSEIVSLKFIQKVRNCCFQIGCMDSSKGYFIRIEDNGIANYFYLDDKDSSDKLCGFSEIDEIKDLFEEISNNYH